MTLKEQLAHQIGLKVEALKRIAELEASEAQLALVLESQDRTLTRYRSALEEIAKADENNGFARIQIARQALNRQA